MFDRIFVWMKCPYCGDYDKLELQTKDLDNSLHDYITVDKFTVDVAKTRKGYRKCFGDGWYEEAIIPKEFSKLKFIDGCGDCHSPKCQFDADRRDVIQQGIPSGFGRCFDAKLDIKKHGKNYYLYGLPYNFKKDDLKEEELKTYKKHLKKGILKKLEKFTEEKCSGQESIGLRMFNFIKNG